MQQFIQLSVVNVPLLAVTKAVKLDFFTEREKRWWWGLCQVHHKLSYTTFRDVKTFAEKKKRQLKEDGGSVQHAGQNRSSCDALESAGNTNERADL